MQRQMKTFRPIGKPDGTVVWAIETESGRTVEYSMSFEMFCQIVAGLPPLANAMLQHRTGSTDPDVTVSVSPPAVSGAGVNHRLVGGMVDLVIDLEAGIRNRFALTPALARSLGAALIDHSEKSEKAEPPGSLN